MNWVRSGWVCFSPISGTGPSFDSDNWSPTGCICRNCCSNNRSVDDRSCRPSWRTPFWKGKLRKNVWKEIRNSSYEHIIAKFTHTPSHLGFAHHRPTSKAIYSQHAAIAITLFVTHDNRHVTWIVWVLIVSPSTTGHINSENSPRSLKEPILSTN